MSDPYWSNVVLAMHMDGVNNSTTFTDLKGKTVTPVGNAKISTTQSKFGGASAYFDGSGDYLSIPHSSDFNFGSNDLTIEFFTFFTSNGDIEFLAKRSTVDNYTFFLIRKNSGNGIRIYVKESNNVLIDLSTNNAVVSASTWYHISVVYNNTMSSVKIFVDGVLLSTGSLNSFTSANNVPLLIGSGDEISSFLNGYIDDLRITKGVARYTSNFTPPTQAFPNSDVATNSSSMFLVF